MLSFDLIYFPRPVGKTKRRKPQEVSSFARRLIFLFNPVSPSVNRQKLATHDQFSIYEALNHRQK